MNLTTTLQTLLASDPGCMRVLAQVRDLALPDCWVGAGFVRNRVWDHLHGRTPTALDGDIDVIWFDPRRFTQERDLVLERRLRSQDGSRAWSVKNQARMHRRNGDSPYLSATDAMRYWPETATAVGVRMDKQGVVEVAAPLGSTTCSIWWSGRRRASRKKNMPCTSSGNAPNNGRRRGRA